MGASLSTSSEAHSEVLAVQGSSGGAQGPDDATLLHQLEELKHSLPILPDSISEPGSMWSRSLRSQAAPGPSSSGSRTIQLSPEPLKQLVTDYQRFTRWHCSRIVQQQENINARIPVVEQQAVQLQHRVAHACKAAGAAQANMAAVSDVQRELAALTARLQRLQASMGEVERLMQQQPRHAGSHGK